MILALWLACAPPAPAPPISATPTSATPTSATPTSATPTPAMAPADPAVDPDAAALAALGVPGPGEGQVQRVEHHLHFPTAAAADSAALALAAQGLVTRSGVEEEGEDWGVRAVEDLELRVERVRSRRSELSRLARGFGGAYAGWVPR